MMTTGRNWTLVQLVQGERTRYWPLADGVTTIGRDEANAVRLVHESVSRRHAQIQCGAEGVLVMDAKSRNGVLVNGVPRQKAALQPGDRLKIGSFELELLAGPPVGKTPAEEEESTETEEITMVQARLLPDNDRELHTLYHICSWFTEGIEERELVPKCLRLLMEAFRAEESQLYTTDGKLEAFIGADPDRPAFKLAAFLAERFQESPEAVAILGKSIARHQQKVAQFNYLVGPLRPLQPETARPPILVLLRSAEGRDFTREDRVLLQLICQMWVRGKARAVQVRDLRRENAQLKQKAGVPVLLGSSPGMEKLRAQALRAAATKVTVLVGGETGSGKEVLAHFIHNHSPRRDGPFIKVNCAAIPDGLIESELFGHVRGAFTDAKGERKGKFAQAHGGTIFMDEIGEMPSNVQAKVLRAIENGEIEPLGSEAVVRVDVRFIAATHRDLAGMVREGQFRQDLFFRLNVMQLKVPALRDHVEDVEILAANFLESFCLENGLAEVAFAADAIEELKRYPWPGNVRELRNIIQRCAASADGPLLDAESVRKQIQGSL